MTRFKNLIKTAAVMLALIVALSSVSLLGTSAVDVGGYGSITSFDDGTATPDTAARNANGKYLFSTGLSAPFKMKDNTEYGLRWVTSKLPLLFSCPITGNDITYPASWGAVEYEYAVNTSTNATSTAWCVQPGVAINGATYYTVTDGGNTKFWDLFNSDTKAKTSYTKPSESNSKKQVSLLRSDYRNAVAATIAYGRAKGADKKTSPYYYAVQLLIWDYLMDFRNPATYTVNSGKDTNLNRVYNTKDSSRVKDVKDAANDILNCMKNDLKPFRKWLEEDTVFKSISEAKKVRKDSKKAIILDLPNSSGVCKGTAKTKMASLKNSDYNISYKIVNQNGNEPSSAREFTISVNSKNQFVITGKGDLETLADNGTTYYVKITREHKGYTKSSKDSVWQSQAGDVQSMVNTLKYSLPTETVYIPISGKVVGKGNFHIKKAVTSSNSSLSYTGSLKGWCFSVKVGDGTATKYETDESGEIEITGIEKNTLITVTELGKEISSGKEADYTRIKTFNGKKYGMPKNFTDKTGNSSGVKTYTFPDTSDHTMTWTNQYTGDFRIKKVMNSALSDAEYDGPIDGWFFKVRVRASASSTATKAEYLRVTDEDGLTEDISGLLSTDYLDIYELGRKIGGTNNTTDYYNTEFYQSNYYGMPNHIYDTGANRQYGEAAKPKTVAVNTLSSYEIEYTNSYSPTPKLRVSKLTDDGDTPEGYYFLVGDFDSGAKKLFNEYTIIGPTDGNGVVEAVFDNFITNRTLVVIELGKKKASATGNYSNYKVSAAMFAAGTYQRYFEVPAKYNKQYNPSVIYRFDSIDRTDALDYRITTADRTGFLNDPDNYVKEVTITNTTSGIVKVHKENNHGEALENIKFYIYEESMLSGENNSNGEGAENNEPLETVPAETTNQAETEPDTEPDGTIPQADVDVNDGDTDKLIATLITDENGNASTGLIPTGRYYIVEDGDTVPKQYKADTEKRYFTLESGHNTVDNPYLINYVNEGSIVKFEKKVKSSDSDNGKRLNGVSLQVFEKPSSGVVDYNSTPFLTFSTKSNATVDYYGVFEVGKKYILHEPLSSVPYGYYQADDVEFTAGVDETVSVVTMNDAKIEFLVGKCDSRDNSLVAGATLRIIRNGSPLMVNVDGENKANITTKTEYNKIKITNAKAGETLYLREVTAPNGFVKLASDIPFTIPTKEPTSPFVVKAVNDPTVIEISKTDITGTNEIGGCRLKIVEVNPDNTDGTVIVPEWTSIEGQTKKFTAVFTVGKKYRLIETYPADGYAIANPVDFTVQATGTVQKVQMKDEKTKVELQKIAADTNSQLSGCEISVLNSAYVEVLRFTTGNTPYVAEGILVAGETYTMKEVKAKAGYMLAEPVTFTVGTDGIKQTVTMVDLKYTSPKLPETGGNSAYLITLGGVICLLCAAVAFVIRMKVIKHNKKK